MRPLIKSTRIIQPFTGNEHIGWYPAEVSIDPMVTQDPFANSYQEGEILIPTGAAGITGGGTVHIPLSIQKKITDSSKLAFDEIAQGNLDGAGREFTETRKLCESFGLGNGDTYRTAVFGEALWGKITGETLSALDRVITEGEKDDGVKRMERLIRIIAYFKAENYDAASNAVSDFQMIGGPADTSTVLAYIAEADIYMSKGSRTKSGKRRHELFAHINRILLRELPDTISEMERESRANGIPSPLEGMKEAVAAAYYTASQFFQEMHCPKESVAVARKLREILGNTEAGKAILSKDEDAISPVAPFIKGGRITDAASERVTDRMIAGASELIFHANHPDNSTALRNTFLGALIMTALYAITGDSVDFSTAMQVIGEGALAGIGVGKVYFGLNAIETREAAETGYSSRTRKDIGRGASTQLLKMLGIYAFFGGAVPGLQYLLPDFLLANSGDIAGQMHGLGSAMGSLHTGVSDQIGIARSFVGEYGYGEGLMQSWQQFSETTTFGSSLKNVGLFWRNTADWAVGPMQSDMVNSLNDIVSFKDPLSSLGKLYMGGTALYAGTTMLFPSLRNWLVRKAGTKLLIAESTLVPAAFMLGVNLGLATGVEFYDSCWIAGGGMVAMARHQLMGASKWNNSDIAAWMRGGVLLFLYTGPGRDMQASLPKEDFLDYFWNSMGVQVGLYPIGFVHALLGGLSVKRQGQTKIMKSFSWETIPNYWRLYFGWASALGTVGSMLIQQFFINAYMSRVYTETEGTPAQRFALIKTLADKLYKDPRGNKKERKDVAGRDEAKRIKGKAKDLDKAANIASSRWRYTAPLDGGTLVERFAVLSAILFAIKKKFTPYPTRPADMYFRKVVFRILTDPTTTRDEIKEFLDVLAVMLKDVDPNKKAIRGNYVISLMTARNGIHGGQIGEWLDRKKNRWITEYFRGNERIQEALDEGCKMPTSHSGHTASKWFKRVLEPTLVTADGMIGTLGSSGKKKKKAVNDQ